MKKFRVMSFVSCQPPFFYVSENLGSFFTSILMNIVHFRIFLLCCNPDLGPTQGKLGFNGVSWCESPLPPLKFSFHVFEQETFHTCNLHFALWTTTTQLRVFAFLHKVHAFELFYWFTSSFQFDDTFTISIKLYLHIHVELNFVYWFLEENAWALRFWFVQSMVLVYVCSSSLICV